MEALGKVLVAFGLGLALLGLALWLAARMDWPIGRLPGDIRIEGRRWTFHFPLVTCIVVSVLLTIVLNVLWRMTRH